MNGAGHGLRALAEADQLVWEVVITRTRKPTIDGETSRYPELAGSLFLGLKPGEH